MGITGVLLTALGYAAIGVFVLGMLWQMGKWSMAGLPFRVTVFPVRSNWAATRHILWEALSFRSLWRGVREHWAAAWFFHFLLALVLLGHVAGIGLLGREFVVFGLAPAQSLALSHLLGSVLGVLLLLAVVYLLVRRAGQKAIRLISSAEDYLMLILLLAIVGTGNGLRFLSTVELAAVRDFVAGLVLFHPVAPPASPWFVAHFTLVALLLLYFPFSKLVHTCGFFFTRWTITRHYPRQVIWR